MHFIVTGGAGFIGSHVTEQLLSEGHHVTVIDTLATGNLENLPIHPRLKLLQKDISTCQLDHFPEAIDGIAHLAATPSVTESWSHPLESHHNNLSVIIDILLLCKRLRIPRIIFASSAAVYGNADKLSIAETDYLCPISPYGLQKLVSEQYATLFANEYNFSFIALRMFNVFGPRQRPSSPYSGVISIFTSAMQEGSPLTINGDGSQTRDFIYVKDVAIAFSKALTIPLSEGSCISLNIGTGQGTSLLQLVDTLRSYLPQWNAELYFTSPRTGDIRHSQANVSQASLLLGFKPQWSVKSGIYQLVQSLTSAGMIPNPTKSHFRAGETQEVNET